MLQRQDMVRADKTGKTRRYGDYLVWFMRAVAVLWLVKGLMHWALVLGWGDRPEFGFADLPPLQQSATVFFAVFDLVAAVGLWMASAWGGVIWLMAVIAQMIFNVFLPEVFGRQFTLIASMTLLMAVYFILTLQASKIEQIE